MATQASPGAGGLGWTLGDRLAKARRHAGLSRAQMAAQLEVSDQTIRNWEYDTIEPRASYIKRWAAMTGVTIGYLYGEEDGEGDGGSRTPPRGGGGPHGTFAPAPPPARNPRSNLPVTSSKGTDRDRNPGDRLKPRRPGKGRPLAPSEPAPAWRPAKRAA